MNLYKMDIKKKVGGNIKKIRLEKKISQENLAYSAEIDRTYLPSIEKGERNISITVLEKIAKALKVNITELLKD
jgi:transcriptional regulator with XRE-family HTH domain